MDIAIGFDCMAQKHIKHSLYYKFSSDVIDCQLYNTTITHLILFDFEFNHPGGYLNRKRRIAFVFLCQPMIDFVMDKFQDSRTVSKDLSRKMQSFNFILSSKVGWIETVCLIKCLTHWFWQFEKLCEYLHSSNFSFKTVAGK